MNVNGQPCEVPVPVSVNCWIVLVCQSQGLVYDRMNIAFTISLLKALIIFLSFIKAFINQFNNRRSTKYYLRLFNRFKSKSDLVQEQNLSHNNMNTRNSSYHFRNTNLMQSTHIILQHVSRELHLHAHSIWWS